METVDTLASHLWGMSYEQEARYLQGLAKMRVGGMTYKNIAAFIGVSVPGVSKKLKPYEAKYRELIAMNRDKLEASLDRNDADYEFMVDPRTVTQQMCALLLGGEEVKAVLNQLMNLETVNGQRNSG
jgi:hypothetical protein